MSLSNRELAYYGLPNKVIFCKKCVISNQRPSSSVEFQHKNKDAKSTIAFDDGTCVACRYQESKTSEINWKEREARLIELLDQHRSKSGGYDVIVPGSGGKDSAYTSHILKYKYGMNPLTVTWAPHLYTDIGWQNFTNWAHVGGHDNILLTPNGKLHRLLTKLAFQNLLHPFQPFIVGQRIIGPAMAKRFGVSLVMYGENQAEYGNDLKDNQNPIMDTKFFTRPNLENYILGGVAVNEIMKKYNFDLRDFYPYLPPTSQELLSANVQVNYLGYYLKWDPQECYYYAVEHTGFEANPSRTPGTYSKYSSIDDKIDMFHYFTTYIKFGIGRATYDAAQEVRNGKITREEAVQLVRLYDHEFPKKYFKEFLDYISISEVEFWETVDKFRSPHLWDKIEENWVLRHVVE